ncbi:hypothetical protein [Isoptericola variabilis]|uniref:hypothetical protein n=1 Tax=Isoptericola variabilis TaxID=139208 RepID=UPI0016451540|nr:hypothetical protein [Isoptericola variabilis]
MTTTSAPPAARPAVPTAVGHVRSEADAAGLARHLQDPGRSWPVVVVSTPRDRGHPYVDPAAVLEEVRGLAEVVVVHDGDPSWAFSHAMPPGTQVYGGASRVYPVGLAWVHDLARSHLWLAYDDVRGAQVRDRLVQDALTAAAAAGLAGSSASDAPAATVTATVLGTVGARALVQTDDGTTLQVAEELTLPGVPLSRLLARGMRVRGRLDAATGRLDVRGMLPDAAAQLRRVAAAYPVGAVVPARVAAVADDAVTLELAPAVRVRVHRDHVTGNDLDLLGDLFSVGEVVLARVVEGRPVPGPAGPVVTPGLRLDDVDDARDEPDLPAVARAARARRRRGRRRGVARPGAGSRARLGADDPAERGPAGRGAAGRGARAADAGRARSARGVLGRGLPRPGGARHRARRRTVVAQGRAQPAAPQPGRRAGARGRGRARARPAAHGAPRARARGRRAARPRAGAARPSG